MKYETQKNKLNYNFLKHITFQIFKKKTPIRFFHNYFLKEIEIEGKVLDLGSGKHSSYLNFINKKKHQIYFADKFHIQKTNFFKVDLENNLNIQENSFDCILLFNVLEHIENHKNLLKEIKKILNQEVN